MLFKACLMAAALTFGDSSGGSIEFKLDERVTAKLKKIAVANRNRPLIATIRMDDNKKAAVLVVTPMPSPEEAAQRSVDEARRAEDARQRAEKLKQLDTVL